MPPAFVRGGEFSVVSGLGAVHGLKGLGAKERLWGVASDVASVRRVDAQGGSQNVVDPNGAPGFSVSRLDGGCPGRED